MFIADMAKDVLETEEEGESTQRVVRRSFDFVGVERRPTNVSGLLEPMEGFTFESFEEISVDGRLGKNFPMWSSIYVPGPFRYRKCQNALKEYPLQEGIQLGLGAVSLGLVVWDTRHDRATDHTSP
ncbi:uncharacterized protein LOC132176201 [Corylus avellana]|uniref:uncharacterized protein LOC132176201 n=1 Tax=Corylus avellana TaxID=13451 RepID=UPI00286ABF6A|nr:uncharacterized protein LOC132176201 [Corylus avellana]